MYLATFRICVKKYMSLSFLSAPGLAWQAVLKKTKVNLDLLIDIDMLLMVLEKECVMLFVDIP